MKAMVWEAVDRLALRDLPEPECVPGSVKVKVLSAGVCATDVHVITGRFKHGEPPHVLGHEICGEVAAVGAGVRGTSAGERVVVETAVGCGLCVYCRTGNKHLCAGGGEIGFPPYPGGYAQYVVVPENCIRKIPAAVGNDAGGILEAVACPFGSLYRLGLRPDDTVLVQGAGVAGLSFAQSAKAFGVKKVIMTVRNETRAAFARRFGADVVVNVAREPLERRVMEETAGRGADLAIDAAGVPATVEASVTLVKKGGRVVLYGIPDEDASIRFPVKEMILNQITVYGLTNNELAWDPLIDLVARGVIDVGGMVTHRFALAELERAVDLVKRHPENLIKAVVHPWEA